VIAAKRIRQRQQVEEMMKLAFDACLEVIEEGIEDQILKLVNLKIDLMLEIGKDDINNTRVKMVLDLLIEIMDNLLKKLTP
jgi:hypothetical protein